VWTAICATGAAISALMNKPHWVTVVTRAGIKAKIEGVESLASLILAPRRLPPANRVRARLLRGAGSPKNAKHIRALAYKLKKIRR
jgi:hypothetical protein